MNAETQPIGQQSEPDWASSTLAELGTLSNVRLMPRTTVIGAFDHGIVLAVERVSDHLPEPLPGRPRQTLWRICTKHSINAGGATERPIIFENNGQPGVLLAGALRAYAGGPLLAGIRHLRGAVVTDMSGRLGLTGITIRHASGKTETLAVSALAVCSGWNPNVNITSDLRARLVWNQDIAAFVSGPDGPPGLTLAGAAANSLSTHAALLTGQMQACPRCTALAWPTSPTRCRRAKDATVNILPFWYVLGGKGRALMDQQNDVTLKDIKFVHQ